MSAVAGFIRYLAAGILNATTGYLSFLLALLVFELHPLGAHLVCCLSVLLMAYCLDWPYTNPEVDTLPKYRQRMTLAFILGYVASMLAFSLLVWGAAWRPEAAQLIALVVYSLVFYQFEK